MYLKVRELILMHNYSWKNRLYDESFNRKYNFSGSAPCINWKRLYFTKKTKWNL